jgi:hypothetical protein
MPLAANALMVTTTMKLTHARNAMYGGASLVKCWQTVACCAILTEQGRRSVNARQGTSRTRPVAVAFSAVLGAKCATLKSITASVASPAEQCCRSARASPDPTMTPAYCACPATLSARNAFRQTCAQCAKEIIVPKRRFARARLDTTRMRTICARRAIW